jgi:hypothetical protein
MKRKQPIFLEGSGKPIIKPFQAAVLGDFFRIILVKEMGVQKIDSNLQIPDLANPL